MKSHFTTFNLARLALMGLLAGLLGACANFSTSLPAAPAAAATPDYTYIIGPGDSVNIIVWRNPELSMSVPVRPDGKVAAPLVDELVAQGKTSAQMARESSRCWASTCATRSSP